VRSALLFTLLCACGTTLHASDYANDCDADTQCERVVVGDICACTCNLAAINVRDDNKYVSDLERIGGCRSTCLPTDGGDDASFACGQGIGAQCSAGRCTTYTLPSDASSE
jgi:hypothetical protein